MTSVDILHHSSPQLSRSIIKCPLPSAAAEFPSQEWQTAKHWIEEETHDLLFPNLEHFIAMNTLGVFKDYKITYQVNNDACAFIIRYKTPLQV